MTTLTTSPYTDSRARVLRAYRVIRQQTELTPTQCMMVLHAGLEQALTDDTLTDHERSKVAWDLAHCKRYLGMVLYRARGFMPYWVKGTMS